MNKIETLFWDFDGVIMKSNEIRDRGFKEVLKNFPPRDVDQLMEFHHENGGLSRYVKFRYFFEKIRGEKISEKEIKIWAHKFSKIMLCLLTDSDLLIEETISFIKKNQENYSMHIVSGSDQTELQHICKTLNIAKYFISINGSPTAKNDLVSKLLISNRYTTSTCVLIGDSKNDYEAAKVNGIKFMGFGKPSIVNLSDTCLF